MDKKPVHKGVKITTFANNNKAYDENYAPPVKEVEVKAEDIARPSVRPLERILAFFSGWTREKKLIAAIVVMGVLCVLCIYYLIFIPRDALTVFKFGVSALDNAESYKAEIAIVEELNLSDKQVAALGAKDGSGATVPVTWNKTIIKSGTRERIKCTAKYTYNKKESSITSEMYEDETGRYVQGPDDEYMVQTKVYDFGKGDAGNKDTLEEEKKDEELKSGDAKQVVNDAIGLDTVESVNHDPFEVDSIYLENLLNIKEQTLDSAVFRSEWGQYKVRISGDDAVNILRDLLAIDDKKHSMGEGTVVYTFQRRSKKLESIGVKDLVLYQETDGKKNPYATLNITLKISEINSVTDEEVEAPAKTITEAEYKKLQKESKLARKKVTLSQANLKRQGADCYVVGKDIAAGTYTIKRKSGSGIIMAMSGDSGDKLFKYGCGYDYEKYDTLGNGKEVKLHDGDRVMLSGRELSVVLKP